MSVLEKASDLIDCLGQAGEPVTLATCDRRWRCRSRRRIGCSANLPRSASSGARRMVATRSDRACSTGARRRPRRSTCGPSPSPDAPLRDQLGESVHLYIRDEDTRICIAAVEARHELARSSSLAGRCRYALARPARSCWHSPTNVQRRELQHATADVKRCRMHLAPTWRASWTSSAPNDGRPRSASGRTAWRRWPHR